MCDLLAVCRSESDQCFHRGALRVRSTSRNGVLSKQGRWWRLPVVLTPSPSPCLELFFGWVRTVGHWYCSWLMWGEPAPLSSSTFSDIMLAVWNWPGWAIYTMKSGFKSGGGLFVFPQRLLFKLGQQGSEFRVAPWVSGRAEMGTQVSLTLKPVSWPLVHAAFTQHVQLSVPWTASLG